MPAAGFYLTRRPLSLPATDIRNTSLTITIERNDR